MTRSWHDMRTRVLALVLAAGCGFTRGRAATSDGSGGGDGGISRDHIEIVAGAGRIHAGAKTIDVQVGHGVLVRSSMAGNKTISGAPVVRP
jgi:hypothetical protein